MLSLLVLLEDCVRIEFGPTELAAVRAVASERTTGPTTLDKARGFLSAIAEVRRKREPEVYRWFGKLLVEPLIKAVPQLVKGHSSTRTIALQLGNLARTAVAAMAPGLPCPDFWTDLLDADSLRVGFDGPEPVADILDGVLRGFAVHFSELIEIERGVAAPNLTQRRLLDLKVLPDRRSGAGSPPGPPTGERRSGVVSGVTTFLR
jgi:hypothetical protein